MKKLKENVIFAMRSQSDAFCLDCDWQCHDTAVRVPARSLAHACDEQHRVKVTNAERAWIFCGLPDVKRRFIEDGRPDYGQESI